MREVYKYKKYRIELSKKTGRYYIVNNNFEHKSLRRVKAEIDFRFYGIGNIVNGRVSNSPHYNKKIQKKLNEPKILFDILKPEYSYLIGFVQADGCLLEFTRGRGRMSIELSVRDTSILEKLKEIIPVNSSIRTRTRDTNFKKNYESVGLFVYDKDFRHTLKYYGVPIGNKSKIIHPPKQKYNEVDYWRGIIDGDGSIGFTENGRPFISLVTTSDDLFKEYCSFIYKHIGIKHNPKRNTRDNAYNIALFNEDAKKICSILYYENCLSISRKYELARKIIKLKIPELINKKWSEEDKKFVMEHSNEDCLIKFHGRTITSLYSIRAVERKKIKK